MIIKITRVVTEWFVLPIGASYLPNDVVVLPGITYISAFMAHFNLNVTSNYACIDYYREAGFFF